MSPIQFSKVVCCFFLALVAVCGLHAYAWCMSENHVLGIRFGKHDTFERVVVDLRYEPTYEVISPEEPDRVVIDIDDCIFPPGLQGTWIGGRIISQVGVSQNVDKTVRIVLELKEGKLKRSFHLPPVAAVPFHRLVIDVRRSLKETPPAAFQKSPEQETPPALKLPPADVAEAQPEKEPIKSVEPSPEQDRK